MGQGEKIPDKYQLSKRISEFRYAGELDSAIISGVEATQYYEKEDIFWKLLGDLYFQRSEFLKAGEAYQSFLERIDIHIEYFRNFVTFWERLKRRADIQVQDEIKGSIMEAFNHGNFSKEVCRQLADMFAKDMQRLELIENYGNTGISRIKKWVEEKERHKDLWSVYIFLYQILGIGHDKNTTVNDKYVVSVMERYELYFQAVSLIFMVLEYDTDEVAVRTLFRLCRKLDDYTKAEEYLAGHSEILNRGNFNIQYELVYYYDYLKDEHGLMKALERLKRSAEGSIPISRTLYNFYLRFGMIDEAAMQRKHTDNLVRASKGKPNKSEKGVEQEKESEEAVWMKMKDLISEQEHNRQLIAMKELLKGFSHELGQPITNIRYGIQLYQLKMELGRENKDNLTELLDSILKQTIRIKHLLNRFSPVVSTKSVKVKFHPFSRIKDIVEELNARLSTGNIRVTMKSESKYLMYGDAVQFDQVFYNLFLNAIEAMRSKGGGKISVHVSDTDRQAIRITFADDGPGIPADIRKKVFEPFYSTKDKMKEEGGEGLGLFIVWNILKMYGGKIRIDENYTNGVKFVMTLPAWKEENDGSDSNYRG